MKKNICLLLIAALMCSCAGQDNGKDDFITISIDPEDSQIVSIADFFEKIAIVPLETNDTILINAVYNICLLYTSRSALAKRSSDWVMSLFARHHKKPRWPNVRCNSSPVENVNMGL